MKSKLVILLIVSALILSTAPFQPALAQGITGARFFNETGHWVRGEFLELWSAAANPEVIYGYPITGEIEDPTTPGMRKQYFQRALFTYDPSRPAGYRVDVEPIGLLLYSLANYKTLEPQSISPNHPACLYDRTTEKLVCYAFRDYYVAQGGVMAFGRPVSDVVMLGERRVQFFERARLEWRPDMPTGQKVVPADIGEEFFDLYENPIYRAREVDISIPISILSLRSRISVQKATTAAKDQQSIYLVVLDQQLRRLDGAVVKVEVSLPSGRVASSVATTVNGVAVITVKHENEPPGMAKIAALIEIAGQRMTTWYSYRIR
jgi:hypothetical protein